MGLSRIGNRIAKIRICWSVVQVVKFKSHVSSFAHRDRGSPLSTREPNNLMWILIKLIVFFWFLILDLNDFTIRRDFCPSSKHAFSSRFMSSPLKPGNPKIQKWKWKWKLQPLQKSSAILDFHFSTSLSGTSTVMSWSCTSCASSALRSVSHFLRRLHNVMPKSLCCPRTSAHEVFISTFCNLLNGR